MCYAGTTIQLTFPNVPTAMYHPVWYILKLIMKMKRVVAITLTSTPSKIAKNSLHQGAPRGNIDDPPSHRKAPESLFQAHRVSLTGRCSSVVSQ